MVDGVMLPQLERLSWEMMRRLSIDTRWVQRQSGVLSAACCGMA